MIRVTIVLALYGVNAIFAANPAAIALTLPVLLLVLIGLGRIRSPLFQIGDMFWFCVFIFFALSPLQRMGDGTIGGDWSVTRFTYESGEYLMAMAIALLFLAPFAFVRMEAPAGHIPVGAKPPAQWVFGLNLVSFVLFVVLQGGVEQVLSPRLEQTSSDATMLSQIFLASQAVTAAILMANARQAHGKRTVLPLLSIAILLLIIVRNPFNASRFSLLAAWVPLVLAMFGGRIHVGWFYAAALGALLVVFPILSLTTRQGIEGMGQIGEIAFSENLLGIPFIDVFDTLVHAVRYMSTQDWMLGQKLVAILLFFVPRSLWPDKPIVGGLDIGQSLFDAGMAGTPNLSFFIGADLYMDFGLVGVALGGVLCALLMARACASRMRIFYGDAIIHFVIIASLPILLRGPVGAVLPLVSCQIGVLILLSRIARPARTTARLEGAWS